MTTPTAPVALFDFDGTLTRRDSLLPFLHHCVGTRTFLRGMAPRLPGLLGMLAGWPPRDRVKQDVLRTFFSGWTRERLDDLGTEFAQDRLPGLLRPSAQRNLERHLEQGHACYLVSASLEVYLRPWGQKLGLAGVLCSQLEVSPAGLVTGNIKGNNVWGPEKVARIKAALHQELPTIDYAYGDSRGDLEMLSMAKQAWMRGKPWTGAPRSTATAAQRHAE